MKCVTFDEVKRGDLVLLDHYSFSLKRKGVFGVVLDSKMNKFGSWMLVFLIKGHAERIVTLTGNPEEIVNGVVR